eukprot:SRR837773.22000.p1 GENE.SRR837773.22000~~SRR837773.22000.p1  ORF type:complete len:366 (-),score=106.04 SRR837773.22000:106-1170(-)
MGCLRCCSILVAVVAVLGPIGISALFDGRVWDLLPGWRPADMPDLTGKVAVVTGPTVNGIGFESCVEMARKGAHVVLAGRSKSKGDEAMRILRERVPAAKAEFMELDLASLASVAAFAEAFKAKGLPLHVLMNNAGVMANPFTLTKDGFESQFGTNHLGHFLLTKLLLPLLEKSAPSRIVTVSSAAAFIPEYMKMAEGYGFGKTGVALDFDHFGEDCKANYTEFGAYGRSKLANVLFTQALARRLEGKKVYANVCHPGGIRTNLGKHVEAKSLVDYGHGAVLAMQVLKESVLLHPPQGAVTQLYLATSPDIEANDIRGQYYRPQAMHTAAPAASTEELQEKLWSASEQLVRKYL